MENFVPHRANPEKLNKETLQDLRKHHFIFGTENHNQPISTHQSNYQKPNSFSQAKQTVSNSLLRQSHFSLGNDKSVNPQEHYMSTYSQSTKIHQK